MRLKRTNFILGLCLILWISVLYYIAFNHSITNDERTTNWKEKMASLEEGILAQFQSNNRLIEDTRRFIETKKLLHEQEERETAKRQLEEAKLPVLVIACNRITISKCLDRLLEYRQDAEKFPIIVSQDCNHDETTETIKKYGSQITLIQQPDQSDIQVPPKEKKFKGYFKIARHYGWALNQIFFNFNYTSVIIVEDDLEIAPDFYEYFLGTYPILLKDKSLWCVSAWNDNGKADLIDVNRPDALYRSDFFPGLGWMLTKSIWMELYTKWPRAYWDDWIRDPMQRKERSCIRPEISRTRTFGKIGVSNGLFFEKHLKYIKLNEVFVPFTKLNLTYLLKDIYDKEFMEKVYQSPVISYQQLKDGAVPSDGPLRIIYRTKNDYKIMAKKLGLMDDFKVIGFIAMKYDGRVVYLQSGVPRTAYKGVVTFSLKERLIHLAPNMNWRGYDLTWS